jgi:hypothetical protein
MSIIASIIIAGLAGLLLGTLIGYKWRPLPVKSNDRGPNLN